MDNFDYIIQRARELAPWHFDFEIGPGVRTAALNQQSYADPALSNVQVVNPYEMISFFKRYYPAGLSGKSVLDVACNAGGYCFVAAELGSHRVTGFDIHEHWLAQAEFIRRIKYPTLDTVHFEKADAKNFLNSQEDSWDIVIFKGILYHLPDPLHVLLQTARVAREIILVDTASSDKIPENCWVPCQESATHTMSGVDGLAWRPGGPAAVRPILEFAGFKHFEISYWRHDVGRKGNGRFRVIASRQAAPVPSAA